MKIDILDISIEDILPSRIVNTNTLYFENLLESISSCGVVVRPIVIKEGNFAYRLEDGHLRIEALKKLNASTVTAVVLIPEGHEKQEDIKQKIAWMYFCYDEAALDKTSYPYIDQQRMFLNLRYSMGKIQEDFTFMHSLCGADETYHFEKFFALQKKSDNLYQYIEQKISFLNLYYNPNNLVKADKLLSMSQDVLWSRINFSKNYVEKIFRSSNQVVDFCRYIPDKEALFGKNSVFLGYVAKVVSNMSQIQEKIGDFGVDVKQLKVLANRLELDNKFFKLRNLPIFLKKKLVLSTEDARINAVSKQQDVRFVNMATKKGTKKRYNQDVLIENVGEFISQLPISSELRNVVNRTAGMLDRPSVTKKEGPLISPEYKRVLATNLATVRGMLDRELAK